MKDGLDSLGASYSGIYRQNVLDRCICEVRDCFYAAKDFGFPVFAANGTRTDLCFERREHPEIRIQARITDGHGCIAYGEKLVQEVQRYSPNSSVTAEHLFEFESSSDEDAFESSIDQWMVFLRPLLKEHLSRHHHDVHHHECTKIISVRIAHHVQCAREKRVARVRRQLLILNVGTDLGHFWYQRNRIG